MSRCPEVLRDACLRQAMAEEGDAARDGRHGVYGGANPRERYELWKRLNPEKAAEQEERSQRIAASRARAQAGRAGPAAA
jgi:hypothetical protein